MKVFTKIIIILSCLVLIFLYIDHQKEKVEREKIISDMVSSEGTYSIFIIGNPKKLDKDFDDRFNSIYRNYKQVLDGYTIYDKPSDKYIDTLNINKIPSVLVFDSKGIAYECTNLYELEEFLSATEEYKKSGKKQN